MHQVRYWHKADITTVLSNVRFWGNSGHRKFAPSCPQSQNGHRRAFAERAL